MFPMHKRVGSGGVTASSERVHVDVYNASRLNGGGDDSFVQDFV